MRGKSFDAGFLIPDYSCFSSRLGASRKKEIGKPWETLDYFQDHPGDIGTVCIKCPGDNSCHTEQEAEEQGGGGFVCFSR